MAMRLGSSASTAMEWSAVSPAPPGDHWSLVGWSMRDSTGSQLMPRSVLLNSPAGATPAQTTFGVFAWPGSMCQVRRKVLRWPSGNAGLLATVHVFPWSRLICTFGPPQVLLQAAYIDSPSRWSNDTWNTGSPGKSGPSWVHRDLALPERNTYAPFLVPTMTAMPRFISFSLSP